MANYGWSLYEQAEYVDSYEWFSNSIREDLDYQDGYNGLGWTFGKLVELDSAIKTFMIGHVSYTHLTLQTINSV